MIWYNQKHRHSAIKYLTPAQHPAGLDSELLRERKALYEAAKAVRPERWSGAMRNWERANEVWLNRK